MEPSKSKKWLNMIRKSLMGKRKREKKKLREKDKVGH